MRRRSSAGTQTGTEISATPASASVLEQAGDLTLGKSVDKTFIGTLPNTVTYTLSPRSDNAEPLENVRVIDPYPAGLTAPPIAVGQGGQTSRVRVDDADVLEWFGVVKTLGLRV